MALTGAALVQAARHHDHRTGKGGPLTVVQRNFLVYRRAWVVFLTGFFEPIFYLFSIGVGVGAMVSGFDFNGEQVGYAAFVAPAMLAAAAMNGAILDSTFNVFFKLKFLKAYDAILATPMGPFDVARGEITWAVLRGAVYSAGFLAIMPMFLFSATFFPLSTYDGVLRWVVEVTPLYRAVVLLRELCTGLITLDSAISVVYLVVMGSVGTLVASKRLGRLLLT